MVLGKMAKLLFLEYEQVNRAGRCKIHSNSVGRTTKKFNVILFRDVKFIIRII